MVRGIFGDARVMSWESHDGTKRMGRAEAKPANVIEIALGPGTLAEAARFYANRGRK